MTDHQRRRAYTGLRSLYTWSRWRDVLRLGPFHPHDIAVWRAVRVAVGVLVPLVAGSLTGHMDYGSFASLGALPAGFASFQGVTRTRVVSVAAATTGMAVSTFIGGATAAAAPWLLVPAVVIWGYITGLAVCLGPRLSVAVLQWPVALLIAAGIPLGPTEAALRAAAVVAGGVFQGVLVAVSWTFRRGDPERAALADSYRSLAAYAGDLATGRSGPPRPIPFPAATSLADPNPLLPEADRLDYLDLLEQAERIRASLAALAQRAAEDGSRAARAFAAEADRALHLIAGTLDAKGADRAAGVGELNRLPAGLAAPGGTSWRWAAEALLGQLRAVTGTLSRLDTASPRPPARGVSARSLGSAGRDGIAWTALTLRGNLTPAGETGRHAVRLAVVAGLAEVMVQAAGLFEGHWVVLTIFLVLKPDYSSTASRSVQRAIGTAVGAGLGAVAAWAARSDDIGLSIAAGAAITAAYGLFDVNYLLYSGFLTTYIVILLDLLGLPAGATATARLTNTAIGAAFALIAFTVWPTWEGLAAREKFARLLEAHGTYTTALLRQFAHPGRSDPARLRRLQGAARRARTDAEASTARLAAEPEHPPLTPTVARILVAAVTRLALAELALHALVPLTAAPPKPDGAAGAKPEDAAPLKREAGAVGEADAHRLDALAAAFGVTFDALAAALRTLRAPGPLPPLRPLHAALGDRLTGLDPGLPYLTDSLVDAADTLDAVLRRHLGERSGAEGN